MKTATEDAHPPTSVASPGASAMRGYPFDLEALQSALAAEHTVATIPATTEIDSQASRHIVEALKPGFDGFFAIYLRREEVQSMNVSEAEKENAAEIFDFADILASVLPETRDLLSKGSIRIDIRVEPTRANTILFSLDQPRGDLTATVYGNDTILIIVIPHNVGPRILWKNIYERIAKFGKLPRVFKPSSIPSAGTLSIEALRKDN